MKVVLRYEYTVELTQEEFEEVKRGWIENELPHYEDDVKPQTEQETDREVIQHMVVSHHVGNYTEFVNETGYDEIEWTDYKED